MARISLSPPPASSGIPADVTSAAATTDLITSDVTGDSVDRFILNADGKMEWGPGNGAIDVTLARSGATTVTLTGKLVLTGAAQGELDSASGKDLYLMRGGATGMRVRAADVYFDYPAIFANATGPQWANASAQQTTVGAAGGASALPATPTKYLKVRDSAGTTYVFPVYAAS